MQKIKADRHINTLYLTFNVSEKIDMQDFIFDLQERCYQLEPGFTCILELKVGAPSTPAHKWMITCVENLLYEFGLGRMVRVSEDEKNYDFKGTPAFRGIRGLHPSIASMG